MKNIKKSLLRVFVCVLAVIMLIPVFGVSAISEKTDEIGYDTYTYWYEFTGKNRKVVPSKPMYETGNVFSKGELGCTEDSKIVDAHVSDKGNTYVLDGGTSRIIVLNEKYEIINTISVVVDSNNNNYYFHRAQGVFVDEYENIYIADTTNMRVLKCDDKGNLIRSYVLPESNLIPTGFNYQPIKVVVDKNGYVYILSSGSYYGAILYSPDDEFLGFYGSNDVPATITQALKTLWNRLVMNNDKRSEMTSSLPFSFSDFWVDKEGFIYTATGTTHTAEQTSQIKRLNPGGTNILNSDSINFADEGYSVTLLSGDRIQDIIGVAVDKDGFIYCLDSTYGRVLIYDSECTMVSAFGGGLKVGEQEGTFRTPSSIAYNLINDDVIITDSFSNTITVFKITEYGKLVKSAQAKTVIGDYEEAMGEWTDVLNQDRNCQLAYAGLAKAYYVLGQKADEPVVAEQYNDKAMQLAKEGYDRETYSLAYDSQRTKLIRDNFGWILFIALIILGVITFALVYSTRHKMRLIKNEKIHLATTVILHPVENFRDIKEKKLTSIPICLVIIALYYVFTVMETTLGGFSFVYFDPSSYNALLILAKTAGIVVIWTFCNWAVCTLFNGKGNLKEIFTVISYSLIPSLIGSFVYVICTNVLVPDEAAFLSILTTVCTLYTLFILVIGTMIVHDYSIGTFLFTTLLTLLACGIVLFLFIVVVVLLQQTTGFFATIYSEILKLF